MELFYIFEGVSLHESFTVLCILASLPSLQRPLLSKIKCTHTCANLLLYNASSCRENL